jgi:hypothetical protein
LYQRSPEQLGLITWRDQPEPPASASGTGDNGSGANSLPGLAPAASTLSRFGNLDVAPLVEPPMTNEAPVDQLLAHLLSQTAALTAATTQLLRATLNGHGTEGHAGSTVIL